MRFKRATERVRALVKPLGIKLPDGSRFVRLYAGRWQRAAGAWSWVVLDAKGREFVGSQWPLYALEAANRVESDGSSLFPENSSTGG